MIGQKRIVFATGKPRIVIEDRFGEAQPKRVRRSIGGKLILYDYGAYFRVVNSESIETVLEKVGSKPDLSPTSRFVYYFGAAVDDSQIDMTRFEVFDLVTATSAILRFRSDPTEDPTDQGDSVGANTIESVRWGLQDSVLSLGFARYGGTVTYQTLVDRPADLKDTNANCCGAIDQATLVIDLENAIGEYIFKHDTWHDNQLKWSLLFSDSRLLQQIASREPNSAHTAKARGAKWEEALQNEPKISRALKQHTVLPKPHQTTLLEASSKWDTGTQEAKGSRLNLSQSPGTIRGVASLDQLKQRGQFDGVLLSVPNYLKDDQFAQRLGEWGLSVRKPLRKFLYQSAAVANEQRATKWLTAPLSKQIPETTIAFDQSGACGAVGTVWEKVPPDGLRSNSLYVGSAYLAYNWSTPELKAWLIALNCSSSPSRGDSFVWLALVTQFEGGKPHLTFLNSKKFGDVEVGALLGLNRTSYPPPRIVAEIYDSKYLMLGAGLHPEVLLFDLQDQAVKWVKPIGDNGNLVMRLYWLTDGRFVKLNGDGDFQVVAADNPAVIIRGRYFDDEIVFFDKSGQYAGTPEGARYVFLQYPGAPEKFPLHQFRSILNRPSTISALLAGEVSAQQPPITLSMPPSIKMEVRTTADGTAAELSVILNAKSEAGLAAMRIFLDGRLREEIAVEGNAVQRNLSIRVPPGTRWITAEAVDVKGVESLAEVAAVNPLSAHSVGRLFIIAAGTDTYEDFPKYGLNSAQSDARKFYDAAAASPYYSKVVKSGFFPDTPSLKDALPRSIDAVIRQATEDDTIAVFIAGHGVRAGSSLFILTRATRRDDIPNTSVEWGKVSVLLRQAKAKVMVFLDVCHGGAADNPESDDPTNDVAAEALLGTSAPLIIVSASKGRQSSYETSTGGRFTSALIDSFTKRRAETDRDKNGVIELDELYREVLTEVVRATGGKQTPWIARANVVGPTPLF